jgi:hypothetical protein
LVGWLEQYAIDGEDQFILQISPFYMDDPNGQYLVTIEYNGLTLGGFLLLASDGSS